MGHFFDEATMYRTQSVQLETDHRKVQRGQFQIEQAKPACLFLHKSLEKQSKVIGAPVPFGLN